jgi:hypothetical protein
MCSMCGYPRYLQINQSLSLSLSLSLDGSVSSWAPNQLNCSHRTNTRCYIIYERTWQLKRLKTFSFLYNIFSVCLSDTEKTDRRDASSKRGRSLQSAQHDPKSAEPLPPRGGGGRLHLDANNGGGLRRRRRARRAPPHHTAVAEETAPDGPEEIGGADRGGGERVQQVRPRERPDVRGARVFEALLLLPQEPGRHHGRLRVQVRSRYHAPS